MKPQRQLEISEELEERVWRQHTAGAPWVRGLHGSVTTSCQTQTLALATQHDMHEHHFTLGIVYKPRRRNSIGTTSKI